MKTINIILYKFTELPEEVQNKIIEKNRTINVEHDYWSDPIIEGFHEYNSNYFDIKRVYFSGFYSQGDGAMFEYNGINEDLFLNDFLDTLQIQDWKKRTLKKCISIHAKGTQSGHYYHEKSVDHLIYINDQNSEYYSNIYNLIELYSQDLERFIIEKYEDLAKQLYRDLEEYYDFLTERDQIVEEITEQDHYYLIDGSIYYI